MSFVALRGLFAAAVLGLFLGGATMGAANHTQSESGKIIVFDHKPGGNEWWVEVILGGQDAGSVASMDAMDYAGPWAAMHKTSYGSWAASFHIDPGNPVKVRATWAGGAQVLSCWFSHPAGVEACGGAPPQPAPANWRTTTVGQTGASASGGDMGIADVDGDGRQDVVVGRSNGLRTFEWSGTAWTAETLSTRLFDTIAVGDGDGDGLSEAYGMAVGSPGMDLVQYRKVGGTWQETPLLNFAEPMAGDMTLGNIDAVAGPEMYVGLISTECDPDPNVPICTSTSTIYLVRKENGAWTSSLIATLNGSLYSMWIADGDNNGSSELYVGHGTRHGDRATQVQLVAGQWVTYGLSGSGSDGGYALVVAGDGDRDGANEVYQVNYEGVFIKHTYNQVDGWSQHLMFGFGGAPELAQASSLFLGDADSDGTKELYLATDRGTLHQIRWTGTAWQSTLVAAPEDPSRDTGGNAILVVGDGDGDGRREAYTNVAFVEPNTGWDGVSWVFKVAIEPFDATFTAARGNQWWEQVSVSATGGTLAQVDVRLSNGAWQPLTKQSWGGYAASYRAVQGTIVQFRATSTAGAADLSDCYQWIPPSNTHATKVTCTGTPPPAFDASFSNVNGHEWWVQAKVTANLGIAKVEARVNCGTTWQTLPLQSWGGYAKSFHVLNGAKVDLRATSTTGATDLSGGYTWPQATPTTGC